MKNKFWEGQGVCIYHYLIRADYRLTYCEVQKVNDHGTWCVGLSTSVIENLVLAERLEKRISP